MTRRRPWISWTPAASVPRSPLADESLDDLRATLLDSLHVLEPSLPVQDWPDDDALARELRRAAADLLTSRAELAAHALLVLAELARRDSLASLHTQ